MNPNTAVLSRCFEQLAESDTDIAEAVYKHFTSSMPDANQHIDYLDSRMKGRMLDQIYQLLLDEVDDNYLEFETHMHRGYGANTTLYQGLLTAVKDAVKDVLGATWTAKEEAAWDASIERIVGDIDQLNSST